MVPHHPSSREKRLISEQVRRRDRNKKETERGEWEKGGKHTDLHVFQELSWHDINQSGMDERQKCRNENWQTRRERRDINMRTEIVDQATTDSQTRLRQHPENSQITPRQDSDTRAPLDKQWHTWPSPLSELDGMTHADLLYSSHEGVLVKHLSFEHHLEALHATRPQHLLMTTIRNI